MAEPLPPGIKDTPMPRCTCDCGCRRIIPRGDYTKCPWCLVHKPWPVEETKRA